MLFRMSYAVHSVSLVDALMQELSVMLRGANKRRRKGGMMRHWMQTGILLPGVMVLSLLSGCATSQPEVKQGRVPPIQEYVEKQVAPLWITKKGAAFSGDEAVFYGVGNAASIINPSLKRRAAEGAARLNLSQEFQVYVAGLQKQYMAETTAGAMDRHSVEQHIEDVMKQVTEQTLLGVKIVEYWEHPDRNEAYALARLDLANFEQMAEVLQSNTTQYRELDEKIKETIKDNAKKLHQELAEELNK